RLDLLADEIAVVVRFLLDRGRRRRELRGQLRRSERRGFERLEVLGDPLELRAVEGALLAVMDLSLRVVVRLLAVKVDPLFQLLQDLGDGIGRAHRSSSSPRRELAATRGGVSSPCGKALPICDSTTRPGTKSADFEKDKLILRQCRLIL